MGSGVFILSRSALSRLVDEGRRYHCVKGGWREEPGERLRAWFPWLPLSGFTGTVMSLERGLLVAGDADCH